MIKPDLPRPDRSQHFTLDFSKDAYGYTVALKEQNHHHFPKIHLLQPFNEWAREHHNLDEDLRALLSLLEFAYEAGQRDAQRAVREALGVPRG